MNINIDHIAKLANLDLSEDQKKKFSRDLEEILQYVDKVEKVSGKAKPIHFSYKKTRPDTTNNNLTLPTEDVLSNASRQKNEFFVTKGVFDEN